MQTKAPRNWLKEKTLGQKKRSWKKKHFYFQENPEGAERLHTNKWRNQIKNIIPKKLKLP